MATLSGSFQLLQSCNHQAITNRNLVIFVVKAVLFRLLLLFSFFFIFDKYHYQNDQREIKEGFLPYTYLNWMLQWWYCIIMLAYEDKNTRIRFCRDDLVLLYWFIEKETHVFDVMLIHGDRNNWIRLYSDNVDLIVMIFVLLCWFILIETLEFSDDIFIVMLVYGDKMLGFEFAVIILYCSVGL